MFWRDNLYIQYQNDVVYLCCSDALPSKFAGLRQGGFFKLPASTDLFLKVTQDIQSHHHHQMSYIKNLVFRLI